MEDTFSGLGNGTKFDNKVLQTSHSTVGHLLTKLRLVRCHKCRQVLPESANVPVYSCGGCNKVLLAKKHKNDQDKCSLKHNNGGDPNEYAQSNRKYIGGVNLLDEVGIVLKQLACQRYVSVGRFFYSSNIKRPQLLGNGLHSWCGFYQSLKPTQMGLSLSIDMSATAFIEPLPVIEFVAQVLGKDVYSRPLSDADCVKVKKALRGIKVEVTHRGNMRRKYCISGLTSQPTRELIFPVDEEKNMKSVIDYFQEVYGFTIRHSHLPSLLVGSARKVTYLPMEACKIVEGQRYSKRLNDKQITSLLKLSCQRTKEQEAEILQSAVDLPDGGHILALLEKKIVRKTLKRKCRGMSVLSLEDHKQHVDRRWEDAAKSHAAKRICRQLVIHRLSTAKCIRKQLGIHQWPFQRSTIGLPDGGHILPLSEKKIVKKTLKRKCRSMSVLSLVDRQQHVDRRWEDAAKNIGAKRICRQLVIHHVSIAKRICRQHGIHHRWPFQQSAIGLPDGGHILPLLEKKIVRKTLKRKCRSMSVISLLDRQQHVDRRWEDVAKSIGAKRICRQLVIHRVSIAKCICRQHGIHHRWPFQQDWATMKGYSLGDRRPVEVIRLSIDGKLVSRLRRIYISWLGRFSPRPSALPRGGLIVGPIALSSSEFAATNNLTQRVEQDQRGSGASGSENERTREQEDSEKIRTSITKDDLLQLHGRMTRNDAAKILQISVSTVKRKCQDFKIGPWKNGGRKRVWRPPDQHGEGNTSTARETPSHNVQTGMEGEPVGQNQEANECRQDFMGRQIALNAESGLIMVSRPPDQHGERSTSTARETPSHNVQTRIEGVPVGQNQEANEFRPDFTEVSIPSNTENGLIIGSSFGWASQVNEQSTLSTPYPNHDALGFPPPQITSMPSENSGASIDLRNSLASQVVSDGHITGSTNLTFATCSDQAAPSQHVQDQSMHPTVYPDHNVFPQTQIVSSQEPFSEGHVFGFSNGNEHTNFVMIKAFYRDGDNTIFKFLFPLTSGIVDLKKEVSKRLNVEVDRFVVKYKDKYEDPISILCDEDLMLYLSSSLGNDEIRVLVLDKVGGTPNFCEKCRSSMQTRA